MICGPSICSRPERAKPDQISGEERYLTWAYRLSDWYVDIQREDGRWQFDPASSPGQLIELNLEFVMHVDTLIGGLAARP